MSKNHEDESQSSKRIMLRVLSEIQSEDSVPEAEEPVSKVQSKHGKNHSLVRFLDSYADAIDREIQAIMDL